MKYLLLALALLSFNAFADDDWVAIATSVDKLGKVEGKAKSFKSNEETGHIIVRWTAKNRNPNFEIALMKRNDCNVGLGNIYFYDTNNKFLDSQPYVSKGGTLSQYVGDMICNILLSKDNV